MSLFLVLLLSSLRVASAAAAAPAADAQLFAPKAYLVLYWNRHVANDLPIPPFFLSKASPLTAADTMAFTKLAAGGTISAHLPSFCAAAQLLCFPDLPSATTEKNDRDANFVTYSNKNFTTDGNGSFKANSVDENLPVRRYSKGSTVHLDSFIGYFDSYNKPHKFTEYDRGAPGQSTATFSSNTNRTTSPTMIDTITAATWVEPGKFFRESMLKMGTVMPMPDIRDKMPRRSFLPRSIASKLPFSTTKLNDLRQIFHAPEKSTMEKIMVDTLRTCERAPSRYETKQCVSSMEDMIDFATLILGRNVAVRSTESIEGSNREILIGQVMGINGGVVTKSVSCHQSLFPYLLYYCHSVPKVRVYEVDILDPKLKAKINRGIAICHLDTSSWSANHISFLALGSGPGQIEVCHWIYENDMTWTIAD